MSTGASESSEGCNLTGAVTPSSRNSTHSDLLCTKRWFRAPKLRVYLSWKNHFSGSLTANMLLFFCKAFPLRVWVDPAYVHTCLLSGSGATAGVLALSQLHLQASVWLFVTCSRESETCCVAAFMKIHIGRLTGCLFISVNKFCWGLPAPHLQMLERDEVSGRCIRRNDGPDHWHFKPWIRFHVIIVWLL